MIRKIDEQCRCYIPKDFRQFLNIRPEDIVDITCEEDKIVIRKHKYFVNYEKLIKSILVIKRGNEYFNYQVTNIDIKILEGLLDKYIDNLIKNMKRKSK